MAFLKLYKLLCFPCVRFVSVYKKNCSTGHINKVKEAQPVPLAYSEYEVDGTSIIKDSPIFIIHGLLGSKTNWNSVSKKLATSTHRQVVALDLRNHGDSPHTKEFDYFHMVADLKQLLLDKKVESGKATLLGHSIGGRVAMAVALNNPDRIRDLIIVDVSPFGQSPGASYVPRLLDALDAVTLKPGQSLSMARKIAGEQLKKFIRGEKLRNFLLTNLIIDEKTNEFVWKINVPSVKENIKSLLLFPQFGTLFQRPCLFIGGTNSEYLKQEDEDKIKKIFPNAIFKYITNAGHLVHYEKPEEFVEIVSDFLTKNLSDNQ